jgi:hypothetical protein
MGKNRKGDKSILFYVFSVAYNSGIAGFASETLGGASLFFMKPTRRLVGLEIVPCLLFEIIFFYICHTAPKNSTARPTGTF